MARPAAESRLNAPLRSGGLAFGPAGPADAADVLALLRNNALGGRFAVSLERGPDPFAAGSGLASSHAIILARDARGEAVGMCERSVHRAFVNGQPTALPYLGGLRVARAHRNRIAVIRGGFAALRLFAERPGDAPFALTSITADNGAAMRLLTAGLPGLPIYGKPPRAYSTFVLRPRRAVPAPGIRVATAADLPAIAAFLNRENARFQFAPAWSVADLKNLTAFGLEPQHFLIAGKGAKLSGCMAVWDQSGFKQTVVRGYPPAIARLRRLLNAASPLTGLPVLPPLGTRLRQAVLSHWAVAGDEPALFDALLDAALAQARGRGFDSVIGGMASAHGLAAHCRGRRRVLEYRTNLFLAFWPEGAEAAAAVDGRPPHPELALL